MGGSPAILERDFRTDVLQPAIEIDLSFFLQFQQRQGGEGLADRAYAKFRVAADGAFPGDVRLADSAAPENLSVCNKRHSRSRNMLLVEHVFHRFLQLKESLGVRLIAFLLCQARSRKRK